MPAEIVRREKVEVTPTSEVRRVAMRFAVVGLSMTAAVYISIPYFDHASPSHVIDVLAITLVVLCPPGLLAIPLFDIEPYSVPGAILWLVIALLNMGLYAIVGALVGRFLWRRGE